MASAVSVFSLAAKHTLPSVSTYPVKHVRQKYQGVSAKAGPSLAPRTQIYRYLASYTHILIACALPPDFKSNILRRNSRFSPQPSASTHYQAVAAQSQNKTGQALSAIVQKLLYYNISPITTAFLKNSNIWRRKFQSISLIFCIFSP